MFTRTIAAAAAATLLTCGGASAQVFTVDGDTTGAPTFNRALFNFSGLSGIGTDVAYQVVPFSVLSDGNVRVETISGPTEFDTYLFVYSSFDPGDALSNGIAGNDDGGGSPCGGFSCSVVNLALTEGDYVAVVTSFANGQVGIFRLEIEGPVLVGFLTGDLGIMATETAVAVTAAQTQGLRQILLANQAARDAASAGASSMVMSSNGLSTANVSVWAEIAGSQFNGDFGESLDLTTFLGQAGVEIAMSSSLAAGVSIGGALTEAEASTIGLDGDALFIQPYIAFADGGLTAIASLAFTHTDYDDDGGTIDSGERFSGSLFVGYDVPISAAVVATPFGYLAGGIESLDTSSGDEDVDFLIGRAGVELSHSMELLNTGSLRSFASLAAEYNSTNEPELSAAGLLTDYDDSRLGGRVELGFDFTLAGTDAQIFAAGNGAGLFTDATSFGGRVGIKIPF